MSLLRGSLVDIPAAIGNLIVDNTLPYMNHHISTPSSHSDDGSERSHAMPSTLIKEQWQLILDQNASVDELRSAIDRCKQLVVETDECSEERKWLVRHLVELRFYLKELEEDTEKRTDGEPSIKAILGHHFINRQVRSLANAKQHCDHCTGIIWSVVQSSYVCSDCGFLVHHKCVNSIIRICAHVITSENALPISEICPEVGLAAQAYKCAECQTSLTFNQRCCRYSKKLCISPASEDSWIEPRLCDYCGLYFCPSCHWNDLSIIPARVVHNWDFTPRKVCRASLQQINLLLEKPVISLEQVNPKLFVFLQMLNTIKKLRKNLVFMRKYLSECRKAKETKLLDHQIGTKRYLIQSTEYYSISDLELTQSGALKDFLNKLFDTFDKHIRNCDICSGKGYICEICGNDEVLYPFDDGCELCSQCNSIYHRGCWTRKNMTCPKCLRLEERKQKENDDQNN